MPKKAPAVPGRFRPSTEQEIDEHEQQLIDPYESRNADTADLDDLLQEPVDPARLVVPARIVKSVPIPVDNIPLRWGGTRTFNLEQNVPTKILNEDLRRGVVTVMPSDSSIRIAASSNEVSDEASSFAMFASTTTYRFHMLGEMWAFSTAATSKISLIIEQWSR